MSRIRLLPALAALMLMSVPAFPQSTEPGQGGMAACQADLAAFCHDAEAGRGRKTKCLLENKAKLSAACVTAVETRAAARTNGEAAGGGRRRMAACHSDLASLCQNVEHGSGRRIACLKENQPKLSAECAAAVTAAQATSGEPTAPKAH